MNSVCGQNSIWTKLLTMAIQFQVFSPRSCPAAVPIGPVLPERDSRSVSGPRPAGGSTGDIVTKNGGAFCEIANRRVTIFRSRPTQALRLECLYLCLKLSVSRYGKTRRSLVAEESFRAACLKRCSAKRGTRPRGSSIDPPPVIPAGNAGCPADMLKSDGRPVGWLIASFLLSTETRIHGSAHV